MTIPKKIWVYKPTLDVSFHTCLLGFQGLLCIDVFHVFPCLSRIVDPHDSWLVGSPTFGLS